MFRKAGVILFSSLAASGLTFAAHVYLARLLGVEGYGTFNLLIESISTVVMLADVGLSVSFINTYLKYRDRAPVVAGYLVRFVASIKLGLTLTASLALGSYWLLGARSGLGHGLLAFVFFTAGVEAFYQYALTILQCQERFVRLALFRALLPGVRLCAVVGLYLSGTLGLPMVAAVHGLAAIAVLALMALTGGRRRAPEPTPDVGERQTARAELLGLTRWTFVASLSVILASKLDIFLLGVLSTPQQLGLYSGAQKYAMAAPVISAAMSTVFMPRAAQVRDLSGLRRYLRDTLGTTLLFAAPLVVAAASAGFFLVLLLGGQFEGSVVAAQWLLSAFSLGVVVNPLSYTFYNVGAARFLTLMNVAQLALGLVLDLALIPTLGARGAAMTTFVTQAFGTVCIVSTALLFVRPALMRRSVPVVAAAAQG